AWIRTMGGGGGGAGGGFGGAGSNIGTGGPGGGGGGGGASGSIDKKQASSTPPYNYGYYKVGAFGGNPGVNADGTTTAGNGANTELNDTENENMCIDYTDWYLGNNGWSDGVDHRAAGGSGGSGGTASVSGSANAVTAGWPTQGKGIEDAPFIVSSTDDWNDFASYVNGGYAFSGNFVKLGANVSVTDMAGTSDANSFQGTFDGDGQTLTFTKGTSAEPFAEEYCAPFRHVKNATIKNLHVAGTIYTSAKKAASFVGESHGALTLTGCISSVNINSSIGKDGTHGGLVSTLSGSGNTIIIEGCVFDGSFATTNGTNNCGGFIGWPVYNTPVIKNSLMIPSSVDAGMPNNTFARWHSTYVPTITNCYYVATTNLPTDQGTAAVATATATANLGSLVEDYGMVKAYANGILVGGTYYVAPATVTLADNADNSTTINDANGYFADVTLSGRTLYKDGAWNTLCLPFNVDNFTGTPLEGATVKTLASTDFSGGTLTMNFSDDVTSIEAGKPYIVKWANGTDIVDPVFNGVTISNVTANAETNYADFVGTYGPVGIYTAEKTNLYLGADNMLYYPTDENFKVNAFRGYFQLKGLTAGEPTNSNQASISAFKLNFGDGDDNATGIITTNSTNSDNAWYSLDGRRLNGKPSRAGIYINKGKKVVIK
ncbi:MAG: hypothetical protein SPL64_07155, partial [Bacteroidaceae bacterium]|nr:hypothetical protein [Bacteroidaceae bacterium]